MHQIEVTKIIEWDMGHRVPNHKNKCRNPHGHRYRLELTLKGVVNQSQGQSDEGMVVDFGDIKELLKSCIHDPLDHGFMIYEHDKLISALNEEQIEEFSFIKVSFIPTAENIILWCYQQLSPKIPAGICISRMRLYETPNSWADFSPL